MAFSNKQQIVLCRGVLSESKTAAQYQTSGRQCSAKAIYQRASQLYSSLQSARAAAHAGVQGSPQFWLSVVVKVQNGFRIVPHCVVPPVHWNRQVPWVHMVMAFGSVGQMFPQEPLHTAQQNPSNYLPASLPLHPPSLALFNNPCQGAKSRHMMHTWRALFANPEHCCQIGS